MKETSNSKIIGFICKGCNLKLATGTCGDHRIETGHHDFNELRGAE